VAGSTYGNNEACEWLLQADAGRAVAITLLSFVSERDFDKLTVIDGYLSTNRVVATLSGSIATPMVVVGGSVMLLQWSSDESVTKAGWHLSWASVCPEGQYSVNTTACGDCAAPAGFGCVAGANSSTGTPCPAGRYGYGGAAPCVVCTAAAGYSCDVGSNSTAGLACSAGRWSVGGASSCFDGAPCARSSAQVHSGAVDNPIAPDGVDMSTLQYGSGEQCEWLLEADENRVVVLSFTAFDTYDYLLAHDGVSSSAAQLARFAGILDDGASISVVSTGRHMHLSWLTDYGFEATGFHGTWYSGCVAGRYSTDRGITCVDCTAAPGFACGGGALSPDGSACRAGRFGVGGAGPCVDCSAAPGFHCASASRNASGEPCPSGQFGVGGTTACEAVVPCNGSYRVDAVGGGVIRHPVAASRYSNNELCVWLLSAGPERSIVVNISSFDTEIGPDVLSIFDGATTNAPVSRDVGRALCTCLTRGA
jgi:CUB/sushi domain-containing protein